MFFQHIEPVTQAIGSFLETIDPENYKRYRERHPKLDAEDNLEAVHSFSSRLLCWQCLFGCVKCELQRDERGTEVMGCRCCF